MDIHIYCLLSTLHSLKPLTIEDKKLLAGYLLTRLFLYSPQPTGLSPPFSVMATLHQSCYETTVPNTRELSLILA